MNIVINKCYGGYGLSPAAFVEYYARKGVQLFAYVLADRFSRGHEYRRLTANDTNKYLFTAYFTKDHGDTWSWNNGQTSEDVGYVRDDDIPRDDPILVDIVREMGSAANGNHAQLHVVEIPDGVEWTIEEYDGTEWISECHRTWS